MTKLTRNVIKYEARNYETLEHNGFGARVTKQNNRVVGQLYSIFVLVAKYAIQNYTSYVRHFRYYTKEYILENLSLSDKRLLSIIRPMDEYFRTIRKSANKTADGNSLQPSEPPNLTKKCRHNNS